MSDLVSRHKAILKLSKLPSEMGFVKKNDILEMLKELDVAYDVEKVNDELDDYLFDRYCIEGDDKPFKIVSKGGID